jgi:Rad3-related DNA helicase
MVKGAGNFECSALSTPAEPATAEQCTIRMFEKQNMMTMMEEHCNVCEYQHQRSLRDRARHLITNYAYYFLDRLYHQKMARRTLTVFDEAHLINDLFVDHMAIFFSEKRLTACAEEISEALKLGSTDVFRQLKLVREHLVQGRINEETYQDYLKTLQGVYDAVHQAALAAATSAMGNTTRYVKLSKLAKKYFSLGCKIDDFFIYGYDHVFEYKPKDVAKHQPDHEVSVKPIFVKDAFSHLINSDYNLLMSATISKTLALRTIGLDPETTEHVRLEPSFPRENKKVVFFKTQNLNYNTMQQPDTVKQLCATAYQIAKHHLNRGESGLILTPSFVVAESITHALKAMGITDIFDHKRGTKLKDTLEPFKEHDGPCVLITPSGYEGIDLAGDHSRWQVIVKAPFPSLGDKRIKVIAERFPDVYEIMTTSKVVQGAGRSVRSADDYAVTYFLDTSIKRLWASKLNEWSNEFSVVYTTSLDSTTE